jgi:GT2 family glycosyltransferase
MKAISIIIPTKDRGVIFDSTLQAALSAIQNVDAEIIVVNDSKQSVPKLPTDFGQVKLLSNPKSGVASARNFGANAAEGELLLFIDDDVTISEASIRETIHTHKLLPNACVNPNWEHPDTLRNQMRHSSFGRFLMANNLSGFAGWYADSSWRVGQLFPAKAVASFHLSISRGDFQKMGGYNEAFPHAGAEDYDFPLRLAAAGVQLFINSSVTVLHNESDRLELVSWLAAQRRRAMTRRVGVEMGYQLLRLEYPPAKRVLLEAIGFTAPAIRAVVQFMSPFRIFDPISFFLIGLLEAASIFAGYTKD